MRLWLANQIHKHTHKQKRNVHEIKILKIIELHAMCSVKTNCVPFFVVVFFLINYLMN
jgi:hypothetical protein